MRGYCPEKWLLHRRVRPEAFAGHLHNHKTGAASYPIHAKVLNSQAVAEVFSRFGTYLLPMAYPEGSQGKYKVVTMMIAKNKVLTSPPHKRCLFENSMNDTDSNRALHLSESFGGQRKKGRTNESLPGKQIRASAAVCSSDNLRTTLVNFSLKWAKQEKSSGIRDAQ